MEKQLAEAIDAWRSGAIVEEVVQLGGGHIHGTFRVLLEDGEALVFQRFNTDIFSDVEAVSQNYDRISAHLAGQGLGVELPRFLPFPKGDMWYYSRNGDVWRVMSFMKGLVTRNVAAHVMDVAAAARLTGRLTVALDTLDPALIREVIPGFFDPKKWWDLFRDVLSVPATSRRSKAADYIQALRDRADYARQPEFPLRVIHGDAKIENFLFHPDGRIGAVLDWDTAMPATVLDEFGYLARSFINTVPEDEVLPDGGYLRREYLEVIWREFLASAKEVLSQSEQDSLLFGLQRTVWLQAVRFLTDFLSGDQYYPIRYPEHNLDRSRNQLGLLLELEAFRPG